MKQNIDELADQFLDKLERNPTHDDETALVEYVMEESRKEGIDMITAGKRLIARGEAYIAEAKARRDAAKGEGA